MAGYNYNAGRSNNMVAAESEGKVVVSQWAKRYRVSAAAAVEVMQPGEAHHTGTGRRGKSRLTPVLDWEQEPTEAKLAAMRQFDADKKAAKTAAPVIHRGCIARWVYFTRRGGCYVPNEKVEKVAVVELQNGSIRCRQAGEWTIGWEKLSGLVIAKAGQVVVESKINRLYDNAAEIARRIS